jgi:DNA-binding transcriptional MerR regulator
MPDRTNATRIGDVSQATGIGVYTLRYYEKIGLLPPIGRTPAGIRVYDDRDLSRLRFIQRAKSMNFSLAEIGQLLEMREDPQHARDAVRALANKKLAAVEGRLKELDVLRRELTLLIGLCRGAAEGCPIIEGLDSESDK